MTLGITLSLVVIAAAICEFVSWLRYPGGGTSFVSQDEVRRVKAASRG